MSEKILTHADERIADCLKHGRSFSLVAGAGSGKTTSLADALVLIRDQQGEQLRKRSQRIACITYTKRAIGVIRSRIGTDELYHISTIHSFLWGEIGHFHDDIRDALQQDRIPRLIEKASAKDNGRASQTAIKARARAAQLTEELAGIGAVKKFQYVDSQFSDYLEGKLSHDDVIEISGYLLSNRHLLRRLLGNRFPFIFVDEAQDTFQSIVDGLNRTCSGEGLPLVGYFGDPWQQIYEDRAGQFDPPEGGESITKVENFRSAPQIIGLLNSFRTDVEQVPAGDNSEVEGSVQIRLIKAADPAGPQRRYTDQQLQDALAKLDEATDLWGWTGNEEVIRLFLVRQMIARRLGFEDLNRLFTGKFSSKRAQDDYESGEHFLLKPLVQFVCPLIAAFQDDNERLAIDILRTNSPSYSTAGPNASKSLSEVIKEAREHLASLSDLWSKGTIKDLFNLLNAEQLFRCSDRLQEHLSRDPRTEDFDAEEHGQDKGDWLADKFFAMPTTELQNYCAFISKHTPYSTQHGVKGEEFPDVLVVYDDIEARWNRYSFTKLLTPQTAGEPTDGQKELGKKLAYVSFSRAIINLRIVLFTPSPDNAKIELIQNGLFDEDQITIAE